MNASDDGALAWADAALTAALLAIDPAGLGGVSLRAGAGPVRDQWLALFRELLGPGVPVRRLPLHIGDERLLGGLDLTATLQAGRPVAQRGLLAEADGGVVVVAMAERLPRSTAGRLVAAIDRGEVVTERDGVALCNPARIGVVALDEGIADDELVPAVLLDRLAFRCDLGPIAPRDALLEAGTARGAADEVAAARLRLAKVSVPDDVLEALCGASVALGIGSVRPVLLALHAARAHAAWLGHDEVDEDDVRAVARLVLAPRATMVPHAPQPQEAQGEPPPEPDATPPEPPLTPEPPDDAAAEPPAEPPPDDDDESAEPPPALDEVVLQAALAALPPHVLARLKAEQAGRERSGSAGKAGELQKSGRRGRPAGVRRGEPRPGQRLNVIETLRAAAPWQRLRGALAGGVAARRVQVRAEDFHITHHRERRETTTIFVVDASGSSALNRMAEAKGAVELLLADCYVRRDRVAVLGFRGKTAELLLPPTRSLVRAKRSLAGLPGGGGTPLAAALDAAAALTDAIRRRGDTPVVVLLTDGRANVALDGTGGRERAQADAIAAARRLRAAGGAVLLVDTSPKAHPLAATLAQAIHATYLPLPYAGAQALSQVVKASARAA